MSSSILNQAFGRRDILGCVRARRTGFPWDLHDLALDMLRASDVAMGRPRAGLVFPAPLSNRPMTTWRRVKSQLVVASGLDGWQFHDMRRSFATALGEAGVPEPVIGSCRHRRGASDVRVWADPPTYEVVQTNIPALPAASAVGRLG